MEWSGKVTEVDVRILSTGKARGTMGDDVRGDAKS